MVLYGITALLLSSAHAGAAPVVTALKPSTVGVLPKKIKLIQDDKAQSGKKAMAEAQVRSSSIQETEVQNVFAVPLRDATVQLRISGFSQLDLSMVSQDQTKGDKSGASNTPYLHIGNTNLKFEASVKKEKMEAGWLVRFNPQINHGEGRLVDRNGVYWKHDDVGQIEGGNIKGVDDSLFKFAQGLIGGANGWDGDLDTVFFHPNETFYCDGTDFIGSTHTATKVSYVSPKIGDVFTLAGSFTPSTAHRGNMDMSGLNHAGVSGAKSRNNPDGFSSYKPGKEGSYAPFGTNNITLVARLDKKHGDWTFGGAFAYIHDSSEVWAKDGKEDKKYALNDTNSFGISGLIGYGKFKFGIEYMNNGKSRLPIDNKLFEEVTFTQEDENGNTKLYNIPNGDKGHAGHVVTTTLQYKWTEKLTSACGYQWTYRKLNEESHTTRQTLTKTINYLFMPGLEGYIEGDLIFLKNKMKDDSKKNDNVGFAVTTGIRVRI